MGILDKFKKKKGEKTSSSKHYLSGKEIRAIAKSNAKITKRMKKTLMEFSYLLTTHKS